jgi:hypothetical protein
LPRIKRQKIAFTPHQYLSKALKKICAEHEPPLSLKDLSILTDKPSESFRRIMSDGKTTSDALLEDIADGLKLSDDELLRLMHFNMLDKFENDYGEYLTIDGSSIPATVYQQWEMLDGGQRKTVIDLINQLVQQSLSGKPSPKAGLPTHKK